jgi:hypothetical protein
MVVVSLTDRLNSNSNSYIIKLQDYYIDDVEASALNFIFPYQNIKSKNVNELLLNSIIKPLRFCTILYHTGVYSVKQECPWGDNQNISNNEKINKKLTVTSDEFNFYTENHKMFENEVEFFRDCLNQYIQGFLDEFNGVQNLPFNFGLDNYHARKIALENKSFGMLEVISTVSTMDVQLGFTGVGDKFGNSQPIYIKNQK